MIKKLINFFDKNTRENFLIRLFSAWSITGIFNYMTVSEKTETLEFAKNVNLIFTIALFVAAYALITTFSVCFRKTDIDGIVFSVSSLSYLGLISMFSTNNYYCLALLFPAGLACIYSVKRFTRKKNIPEPDKNFTLIFSIAVGVFTTAIIALIGAARYLSFATPNFDFGIFAQMYYYLKTELIPMTTCEREKLLSHFAVHLSPVYYLLLPVYFIFDSPLTLQISQAVILGSSLIPLYLLMRHFKLSDKVIALMMIAFAFYPAVAGGTMYDFHENCFLLPFILWLLYFAEKEKHIPMYIFMLLTFSVKEDAAVYIAFIALYFIFSGRKKLHGSAMLLSSIAYFVFALTFLKSFGEGAMTGRFENFMTDPELGLIDVIFTIFKNPAYFISQCISEEKLIFILFMLLPLAFLPVISRKWSQFILAGPLVLINLMSDYPYQHSIYFQYVYGTIAVFFYLAILNLSDNPKNMRKYLAPLSAVFSVIIFAFSISPKLTYVNRLNENKEDYVKIRAALDTIDEDASVLSTTFFIPYLSQRKEVYEIEYCVKDTDYIVIDLRYESADSNREKIDMTKYELELVEENLVEIYSKIR